MALHGIDISNWQADIIIDRIECDFVIVKATQGTWYTSQTFKHQADATLAAGKKLGVYHYAEGSDVQKEVDHFLGVVGEYVGKSILCLDWEKYQNRGFGITDYSWCSEFLDTVFQRTGVRPLLYCQLSIAYKFNGIGDYGMWIAQYASNNNTYGYDTHPWNEKNVACAIRQYTSHGRLPGYNGNLDLDKFYGDTKAWDKYANPSGIPRPTEPELLDTGWIQDTEGLHYYDEQGHEVLFVPGWGGVDVTKD